MKILFLGESLAYRSGLSKVIVRLMKGFYDLKEYQIAYSTVDGRDSTYTDYSIYGDEYKDLFLNMTIYNCQLSDMSKYKNFDKAVDVFKPEIVISCVDPWKLDQIYHSAYRGTFFWIHYGLFETPLYPDNCICDDHFANTSIKNIGEFLRSADLHIPVTKMGSWTLKNLNVNKDKISENVYLGLDPDKKVNVDLKKKEVFGQFVSEDDFIFMTMGKNSERKKIDKVIEAFYLFLKEHNFNKKYKLYLHSNIFESVGGTDIIELIRSMRLNDNILVPTCFRDNIDMSDAELQRRYKVCDCYISLPAGGGFEYGFLEAMQYGKPIIFPNYGGFVEYCRVYPKAYECSITDTFYARNAAMKWALPNIQEAVNNMNKVISDTNQIDYDLSDFDWNHLINKFIKIVNKNYIAKPKSKYNLRRIV